MAATPNSRLLLNLMKFLPPATRHTNGRVKIIFPSISTKVHLIKNSFVFFLLNITLDTWRKSASNTKEAKDQNWKSLLHDSVNNESAFYNISAHKRQQTTLIQATTFPYKKQTNVLRKKMHLVLFLFVSVSYLFIFSFVSFSLVNVITSNTYYCVNLSMLRVYLPLLSIHNHSISSETNDHFCSIDTSCTAGKKREKTEKIMNQ